MSATEREFDRATKKSKQRLIFVKGADDTVFELVDQAVDFVMSKLDRSVGTRAKSNAAPVTYELPTDAVAEAIVYAVCHRDYASKASV